VNDEHTIQTTRIASTLWVLVGAACGVVAWLVLAGRDSLVQQSGPTASLWLAMGAFVVLAGGMALELARGRRVVGYRWVAAALLVVAVTWGGAPVLPTAAWVLVGLGVAAAVALLVQLLFRGLGGRRGADERPTVPARSPGSGLYVGGYFLPPARIAALGWVAGAVLGVAVAELAAIQLAGADGPAMRSPLTVAALRHDDRQPADRLRPLATSEADAIPATGDLVNVHLVDGDWQGKVVVFDHAAHIDRQGGKTSCGVCHHRNLRLDRATSCATCHRRMAEPADIFAHQAHVTGLGGNRSCVRCHAGDGTGGGHALVTTSCDDAACHGRDIALDTVVRSTLDLPARLAPSYADAMHGLCMDCHRRTEQERRAASPYLSRCTVCHQLVRGDDGFETDPLQLETPPPEVPGPAGLLAGDRRPSGDALASAGHGPGDDVAAGRRM